MSSGKRLTLALLIALLGTANLLLVHDFFSTSVAHAQSAATATPITLPPTNTPRPTIGPTGYPVPTGAPPAADIPQRSSDDMVSILLLGSDTIEHNKPARTDVIVVVVVDRTTNDATMLHIPRDMYVYVPNDKYMKINTVMNYGDVKYGQGQGAKLLINTILYNFGIKIDFYGRVDMVWFEDIVKELGGLDITVDCAIQGNRLINVKGDYNDPNNWELYTLPIGERTLDPYMALWYVRTRYQSSDLDRGRRQEEVLRAIWREAKAKGLLSQAPTLWPEAQQYVETNMGLTDVLGFVPTALALNPNDVHRIDVFEGKQFVQSYSPDDGEFIYIPIRDAWKQIAQTLVTPPTKNHLSGENPTVEIGAAQALKGYDATAADRLAWDGFSTTILPTDQVSKRAVTVVYDYTGGSKPSSLETLVKDLRINSANIINQPDPNRTADFRVEMGVDYGQSCLLKLPDLPDQPQPTK